MSLSGCTPKGCSFLPRASLLILSHHLEKSVDEEGELSAQIVGVARNNSAAELQYAEVIGKFYDKHGTLLATGLAKTVSEEGESFTLDPGQIWDFTIAYSAETEAHPSLKILSCKLEKDGSTAKAVGEVQNDGDVMLSYAQITATFTKYTVSTLTTGTASLVDIEVGETREYEIFYPGSDYDNVLQATAEVTSIEYDEEETLLASSTASTTDLEVGETWDFSILYPKEDYEEVDNVTVEVTTTDYPGETYYEPAEEVDHATVEVGALRGSTVMP